GGLEADQVLRGLDQVRQKTRHATLTIAGECGVAAQVLAAIQGFTDCADCDCPKIVPVRAPPQRLSGLET
ncbi:MAG: hypothetical protein ACK5F7_11930, partial [Planctomycetaceae bacterium]